MEIEQILETLNTLYRRVLKNETIRVFAETTARDVDGWDSLSHMQLIAEIEQEFKVKFALKEIMKLKNVGDICVLIKNKVSV